MFTGLVEEIGEVTSLQQLGDSVRLVVRGPLVTSDAALGDSIAVNGCCLTVTERDTDSEGPGTFSADVMAESLARTALGDLSAGDRVNLERAAQMASRLGGHIVQGHVDGTGRLIDRAISEHWEVLRFSVSPEVARYLVPKGSVTVQGVSLTVVEVVDDDQDLGTSWFSVSLIPSTLSATTLGLLAPTERVNLEVDIVAKYVERLLPTQPVRPTEQRPEQR